MTEYYLIDGTYELFRAYFGYPSAKLQDGREVGATRGFLRSIAGLLQRFSVSHAACAFDHVIESFRNDLFDGYKTGDGIEPDLWHQFPLVEEASRALGIATWPMKEFEADDGLATASYILSKDPNNKIIICSPDKDLCQCLVKPNIETYSTRNRTFMGRAEVLEKFGVEPESIADLLALVGDKADGVPGIAKWGMKSASQILKRYTYLESIPEDHNNWKVKIRGAQGLSKSLNDSKEDAFLYRTLTTLRVDAPLDPGPENLELRPIDLNRLHQLCVEIDDMSFFRSIEGKL